MDMYEDCGSGVYMIDSEYLRRGLSAVFAVVGDGEAAIVETAHAGSLPICRDALAKIGVDEAAVKFVMLTHVHLDHAGGAGAYMRAFPNAKLVVHERGAKHMIDPSKLMAATKDVYGAERAHEMYGELLPIDASRVVTPADGETFEVGGRRVRAVDTPGHCRHHLAFLVEDSGDLFAGDAFGVTFADVAGDGGRCIMPTTSPTQFDPDEMQASIDKIMALEPKRIFATHFGDVGRPDFAASDLKRAIATHAAAACGDEERVRAGIVDCFTQESLRQGWFGDTGAYMKMKEEFVDMNAAGVKHWYDLKHGAEASR